MKIFIVLAHPEHQSFNGAMFRTAVDTLSAAGHEIKTSDLHAMQFDPVSGRHNFLSAKDPDYFKQQIEELHATETYGFAEEIEERDPEDRMVRPDDLAVSTVVVRLCPDFSRAGSIGCSRWDGPMAETGSMPTASSKANARCFR